MRQLLAACITLNVALGAVVCWRAMDAAAAGQEPSRRNGDVNADGAMDISDAVYLLNWLFGGGPEPVAVQCPPTASKLPATGMTRCYDMSGGNDGAGTEISCGSPEFPGQDAAYQAGCLPEGRFVDNGDGTVTDLCTELMWQRDTADVNRVGAIPEEEDQLGWTEALQYCEQLDFAGYDDWRLPNVRELQSILDYGRTSPAVDPVFGARLDLYWTSTAAVGPGYAWRVEFDQGSSYFIQDGPFRSLVRAVRGGL